MSDEKVISVASSKIVQTSHLSVIRDAEGKVLYAGPTEVDLERYPDFRYFTDTPAAERGRIAAIAGDAEDSCPFPDDQTNNVREWLRGYREVQ